MQINFESISEFLKTNASSKTPYSVSRNLGLYKYEIGTTLYLDYFDSVVLTNGWWGRFSFNFTRIIESGYNNVEKLYNLILDIFQNETIESYGLTQENFLDLLKNYQTNFPENSNKIEEIEYFRIEEERDTDRLILSIDPPTGIVRFAITSPSNEGIFTAVNEYFYDIYDYHGEIQLIEKNDSLNFLEKNSYPQHPKNRNNFQIFEIDFAQNSNITPMRQLSRSFKRQIEYVNKYLKLCVFISLQDAYGKKDIDIETEMIAIEGKPNYKFYLANRVYCMPQYKMILITEPVKTYEPQIYATKIVLYQPLYKETTPETKGYTDHDILCQGGK